MKKILPFLLVYSSANICSAQTDSLSKVDSSSFRTTTGCNVPTYTTRHIPFDYVANFSRIIDGKVAGIQSTNGGGQPGSDAALMIRGYSTRLGDNKPLIVVDGFPYFGELSSLDPMDLESVTILRDAMSSIEYSQYENANGVVKVITKKGKRKQGLTVEGRVGITTNALRSYKTMGVDEYYETAFDGLRNDFLGPGVSNSEAANFASNNLVAYLGSNAYKDIPDNQIINPATGKLNNPGAALKHNDDWNKELRRVGLHHSYNLSFGNATDKTDYTFNAGYVKEQGYIPNTSFERLNARLNVNHKFTNWLSAGVNAAGSMGTQHLMNLDGSASYNNPIFFANAIAPIYPVYYRNAAGEKEIDPATGDYVYDFTNKAFVGAPYNPLASINHHTNRYATNSLTVLPHVRVGFLKYFSFTSSAFINTFSQQRLIESVTQLPPFEFYGRSSNDRNVTNYSLKQLLSWERQIGKHGFDAQASIEMFNSKERVADTAYDVSGMSQGLKERLNQKATVGVGIFRYSLSGKYYAEAAFSLSNRKTSRRREESASNYSFGMGWNISEETFLRNSDFVSLLKLRASYGTQTGRNIYTPIYFSDEYGSYTLTNLCRQFNAGLDFGFFNRRLNGSIDYYTRSTPFETFITYNPSAGMQDRMILKGFETVNRGIEVSLDIDVIREKAITWNVALNASGYKSKLSKNESSFKRLPLAWGLLENGRSTTNWFMPESAGVDPATGQELWHAADAPSGKTNNYMLAAEINNRVDAGQYQPTVFGGLQNLFLIGKFDFRFNLTYSLGGKLYDAVYQQLMSGEAGANYSADLANRWTPENTNTDVPKATVGMGQVIGASTRFLRSASFLNIRTVTLGYTFKEKGTGNKQPKSLRVYITADNLWLFAAHRGMNPQDNFDGITRFSYSPARTILFGVSVGL